MNATVAGIAVATLLMALGVGVFAGVMVGFRLGQREGRREAALNQQAHWVDLIEQSISQASSRAAHPSRAGRGSGTAPR